MMKTSRYVMASLLAATFSVMGAEPDTSKLPPAATTQGVTYAKDIKPIFDDTCVKCHGQEKQKAKMRLDSLAATLKGGENGPDVIAGKSEKSPLVWAIARIGDEDDAMPPKKKDGTVNAVSKEKIALIRAWIDQGAK
jgi:mono/diheme cytochrome c family protein